MTLRSTLRHSTAFVALVYATAASADVTAQQVWDNWTSQMEVYGQGFTTGGEVMSGDTLTISDVRIEMSDDEASVLAELGDIALTENGDGTVSVTMSDSYPMTLNFTPEFGDPGGVNMTVSQDNMLITVSGDPDAMSYEVTADEYAITIDSLTGEAAEEVTIEVATAAMRDVTGKYTVVETDLTEISYDFSMGALDIDVNFAETGGSDVVLGNADIANVVLSAMITLPDNMDMTGEEMPPFADGLAMTGGYTFDAVNYSFDINADGEALAGTASAEKGQLDFSANYDGVAYSGGTTGLNVSVSVPSEFPFPIDVSMQDYGFDFQIPLSQGDGGARDARIALNFTELSISEILWNLADPGQVLPREPFTVALGLDASVTPFADFLDPEQEEAIMMMDIPGELNSLDLTSLIIKGAGAEITGDGTFTFDNSDLATFDGFPRPQGTANFAINGVNGLVDNLIQMGIIPQEEAMMPRMMLGMFATPVGDDMLTSSVEVNEAGHVLVNGQRLR